MYTKQGVQIAPEFLKMMGVQAFVSSSAIGSQRGRCCPCCRPHQPTAPATLTATPTSIPPPEQTLGNHEFDDGPAGTASFIKNVSDAFPILSCNLDVSEEPLLKGLVQRYALLELPFSNLTVAVVGLTAVDTAETSNPGPTVRFLAYNETLPGCIEDALNEGADIVILLSHIGFDVDLELAASSTAAGVDLIVGGHTHTLLWGAPQPAGQLQQGVAAPALLVSPPTNETAVVAGPYPTLVEGADGSVIPVVQAQYASRYLGRLNATFEAGRGLVAVTGTPLLLGGRNSTNFVEGECLPPPGLGWGCGGIVQTPAWLLAFPS